MSTRFNSPYLKFVFQGNAADPAELIRDRIAEDGAKRELHAEKGELVVTRGVAICLDYGDHVTNAPEACQRAGAARSLELLPGNESVGGAEL